MVVIVYIIIKVISYSPFFYWWSNIILNINFSINTRFTIINIRNYLYLRYIERIKLIYELLRYINLYTSEWIFLIYIQPKQDIIIPRKDNNVSDNFGPYEDKKSILEKYDIQGNYKNLVDKNLNTKSCIKNGLSKYTSQTELFRN